MRQLVSEKLPSDGGFQPLALLREANERLAQIGKHGKTCKVKRVGQNLALQFSHGGKQKNVGCQCSFTRKGIKEAEGIAKLVTLQLVANQFTIEWLDNLLGKKPQIQYKEGKTQISCKDLCIEYKNHWFKENKHLKNPDKQWYDSYKHIEGVMSDNDALFDGEIIKQIVNRTENNSTTRTRTLNALVNLYNYHGLTELSELVRKYKERNNPKSKIKYVPSDAEIKRVYRTGFRIKQNHPRFQNRPAQWQFCYGLLATYGLRIHEAWNIANWDNPVTIHDGDWLVVEVGEDEDSDIYEQYQGSKIIVPAFLDPNNSEYILCIKHDTKTGYRMAMPLSPKGENWVSEFNLVQPLNLPDIEYPLKTTEKGSLNCSKQACKWFQRRNYGFTPHALRHSYNHRGHSLGINPTVLSQSLGHSMQMTTSTYLRTMPEIRKLENLKSAIEFRAKEQSDLEKALADIQGLKTENNLLKTENELLRFQLKLLRKESAKI